MTALPRSRFYVGTTIVWAIAATGALWQVYLWITNWGTVENAAPFPVPSALTVAALLTLAVLRVGTARQQERIDSAIVADRRHLVNRLLQAEEEERSRIAGELHDDTVQCMAACLLMLDVARTNADNARSADAIAKTQKLLREALERTRTLMFEMAPAVLNHSGLKAGVEALVDAATFEMPEVAVTCQVTRTRFEQTQEAMAFRLIREAVMNARKHAEASKLDISAEHHRNGKLVICVVDNGKGFNVDEVLEAPKQRAFKHLGLASIVERTRLAGGHARVTSVPGCTTVRLVIPVSAR